VKTVKSICGDINFNPSSIYKYVFKPISILSALIPGSEYDILLKFQTDNKFSITVNTTLNDGRIATEEYDNNVWTYNKKQCLITVKLDDRLIDEIKDYVTIDNNLELTSNNEIIFNASLLGLLNIKLTIKKFENNTPTTSIPTTTQGTVLMNKNLYRHW
jgi:hypothetical protein